MAIVHLTASLQRTVSPDVLRGRWRSRWYGLQRCFDDCLAACLRRDHNHLLVETEEPDRAHRIFKNAVLHSTRDLGPGLWSVPRQPVLVRDRNHLYKTVRYILRNPLAEDGVDQPLRWLWSTLRDVVGAAAEPWCNPADLARVLGKPLSGFDRWCLRWVTEDASSLPATEDFPVPAAARDVPSVGLDDLLLAVRAATRSSGMDARRKRLSRWLFVALARQQGWRDVGALAAVTGVRPKSVHRIGLVVPPQAMSAAILCLGDERLLRFLPAPGGGT